MEHQERIWFVAPATPRDVVVDPAVMEAQARRLASNACGYCPFWVRGEEAVSEAQSHRQSRFPDYELLPPQKQGQPYWAHSSAKRSEKEDYENARPGHHK